MTRQLEYKVGDTIIWGVNEIGNPGIRKVKAYGIIENEDCQYCKAKLHEDYDVFIEKDVIINISPIRDISEYLEGHGEYVVLN